MIRLRRPRHPPGAGCGSSVWVRVGGAFIYAGVDDGRIGLTAAPGEEPAAAGEVAAAIGNPTALDSIEVVVDEVDDLTGALQSIDRIVKHLSAGADARAVAEDIDAALALALLHFREGRFRHVLRLAHVLVAPLLLAYRWRDLVSLLRLALDAARELGDLAEEAWVRLDLGSLAAVSGDGVAATELFGEARELFERVGDHLGAELSVQNAAPAAPVPPPAPAWTVHGLRHLAAPHMVPVLAGAIVLVVGVVFAGIVAGHGWPRGGGPTADIVAFAVETDPARRDEGRFDEKAGWVVPRDAVEPGGTLRTCNPVYLRTYIRFARMTAGQRWSSSSAWPRGKGTGALRAEWASPRAFTVRLSDYDTVGAAPSGEPLPPGRYEVAVKVGDRELDRQDMTIASSC
jgi:hypothetical protein